MSNFKRKIKRAMAKSNGLPVDFFLPGGLKKRQAMQEKIKALTEQINQSKKDAELDPIPTFLDEDLKDGDDN
jgi:NADH:ubiquinone oxidoreductase subunit B-like Fe-S oxidoreductase